MNDTTSNDTHNTNINNNPVTNDLSITHSTKNENESNVILSLLINADGFPIHIHQNGHRNTNKDKEKEGLLDVQLIAGLACQVLRDAECMFDNTRSLHFQTSSMDTNARETKTTNTNTPPENNNGNVELGDIGSEEEEGMSIISLHLSNGQRVLIHPTPPPSNANANGTITLLITSNNTSSDNSNVHILTVKSGMRTSDL